MADKLSAAYRRCREQTRHAAKNFYWAFITLPRPKRAALSAVYSLLRRWDDIADSERPPDEKRRELELQRGAILDLYREHVCMPARVPVKNDELLLALGDTIRQYEIPCQYFLDVLEGIGLDLRRRRYQTFAELREYCYGVAGAVGLISLEIFGYRDPRAREHAIDLGIAMQLVNVLRDIAEDLQRDRIYLPLDEVERFNYSEEELRQRISNDNFRQLMRFQAARAREYFGSGRKLLRHLPPRCRPCPAVLAGTYQRLLERIEARGYCVFDGRISLSPREKLWTAIRHSAASLF